MAITFNANRQYAVTAEYDINFDDLVSGASTQIMELPVGALVVEGGIYVTTAFDSATSDTLDVGTSGDPDRYIASPQDIATLGFTALVPTEFITTTTDGIYATWVGVSTAPTVGVVKLVITYIIEGRAHEAQ